MRTYFNQLPEVIVSTFFAILASVVLLYISISSGIGPWIAPVIVLACAALGRVFGLFGHQSSQRLALLQAMGAHVGLMAVAAGFTIPTYFFIDKTTFMDLVIEKPWAFCTRITLFFALWSIIGTFLGRVFAEHFLQDSTLKIPVADVVKTTINASGEKKEFESLLRGVGLGAGLCVIKEFLLARLASGFLSFVSIPFIGDMSVLVRALAPSIWAVGFIAGPAMAIAFFVGIVSKGLVLQPLHGIVTAWYPNYSLSFDQYLVAVSSGLILTELFAGLVGLVVRGVIACKNMQAVGMMASGVDEFWKKVQQLCSNVHYELLGLGLCMGLLFFWWVGISSVWLLAYLTFAVGISVYQMTLMAGQIGLVQFGRFATFVMLPALVFFSVTPLQAVIISAVVCVVGAATANMLFQFRLADEYSIPRSTMYKIQLISSLLGAVSIAIIFWLLCSHLTLGSKEFFAFRGYSRALLIQSFNFDMVSVAVGLIFGLVLRYFGAAPSMVLGGLLMPKELVIAFVVGAGIGYFIENPKKYMATASGVFAAEAVWVFVRILGRVLGVGF